MDLPVIASLAGPTLTTAERAAFQRTPPLGYILFARNCEDPRQLSRLTAELRSLAPERWTPIAIDQEGGRVRRLRPPQWPEDPACGAIGALYRRDAAAGLRCAWLQGYSIGSACRAVGVDVVCAPVLDLGLEGATSAIGDRAFSASPEAVAACGREMADGLSAAGVSWVIKHAPGHGRARVDSHVALPVVDAEAETLERTDLAPFRALAHAPFAMTSHVVYSAIDARAPATCSSETIERWLRGRAGLQGFLLSDDIGMGALSGSIAERTLAALEAGCDAVLHCDGDLDVFATLGACGARWTEGARARIARAERMRGAPIGLDPAEARAERAALFARAAPAES